MSAATYLVFVRDTSNNEIGQVDDYEDLTLNPRFCDIGAWSLTVASESPSAALLTSGAGIVVYRNGSVFMSGPIGSIRRDGSAKDALIVSGPDDMTVLADRLALPTHGYPYSSTILNNSPLRYYRLRDTTDASGNGATLTVNGGVANAFGLIDDPDLSATFDGFSAFLSSTATGLPTGAAAISLECWVYLTTASTGWAMLLGNRPVGGACLGFSFSSGIPQFSCGSKVVSAASALSLNTVHHLGGTYNGSTMTLYVDGAPSGTPQTVTLALAYPNTNKLCIGANTNSTASEFFSGTIDEAVVYASALSAADVTAHYNLGISRFAGDNVQMAGYGRAGTGIWSYIDLNVGPDAGGAGSGDAARVNSALNIGSVPTTIGSFINASARFDNLLQLCQGMAVAGGDIGFRVLQSGTSLGLTIYTPADKTSNAKFSRDLGNLLDYDYEIARPKCNYVYVLGGGQGTSRKVLELSDSASITAWNARIEGTVDARDTSDADTMQARGNDFLAKNKAQVNFSCTAVDTDTLTFGTDYGLGDKVSIYLPDGTTVTDIVREVLVDLTRGGGESVKVGVGNAGNGAILTPQNAALRSLLVSHVAVATRVAQLERRY